MALELQKPVDRRFKSDHPHALLLVAVALFLLAFPVVPWASVASGGSQTSAIDPPQQTGLTLGSTTTQASTCLDGSGQPLVSPSTRVALVQPIFTATPYSQYIFGSFYDFYSKYLSVKPGVNITTDLNLLNTSVASGLRFNSGWGHSFPLYTFMKSHAAQNCGLGLGKNLKIVSDINVTQGALFSQNGSANFDVAVYGFAEYVSQPEYNQLVKFVASGGRVVIMGGDAWQVKVYYNPKTKYETYVVGHGFGYNNKTAWRNSLLGYDLARFTAGIDCCFRTGTYSGALLNKSNTIGAALARVYGDSAFKSYTPHEEDSIRNFTDTSIIGTFRNSSGTVVAAYVHRYGKGYVVCFCVFADDVILTDESVQYFAVLAISTPASELIGGVQVSPVQPSNLPFDAISAVAVVATVAVVSVVFYLVGRRRSG